MQLPTYFFGNIGKKAFCQKREILSWPYGRGSHKRLCDPEINKV